MASAVVSAAWTALDYTTGIPSMIGDVQTIFSGNSSFLDKVLAVGDIALNVTMDVSMLVGVGEGMRAAYIGAQVLGHVAVDVGEDAVEHAGEDAVAHVAEHELEDEAEHTAEDLVESCALSFAATTLVATPGGGEERPIASLKAGDHVTAYDPTTGKASAQTVEATHVTHDTDLLDVTLRVTKVAPVTTKAGMAQHSASASGAQSKTSSPTTATTTTTRTEVVHTTANHPWFTADHGWLPASFMRVGEPVQTLDGASGEITATVVAIRVVPGAAAMYDLTVSTLHDFAVGAGEFLVHNANCQTREITSRVYDNSRDAFDEVSRRLGGTDDLTEVTTFGSGPYEGLPNGRASADGERSWRLDYDPETRKRLHFNWMDSTAGAKESGARWGAVRMLGNERDFDLMVERLFDEGIDGMLR